MPANHSLLIYEINHAFSIFPQTEAIDSPRIAPERESPQSMEPLETMTNQQSWDQLHGPSDRRKRGRTRRGAGMLLGRSTPRIWRDGAGEVLADGGGRSRSPGGGGALHLFVPHTKAASSPPPSTCTLAPPPEHLNLAFLSLFLALFPSPSPPLFKCLSYLFLRQEYNV